MNKKNILVSIVVGFLLPCCCSLPILFASTLPNDSELKDVLMTTFGVAFCIGLPLIAFGGGGWTITNIFRSQKAGTKLAQEMGLVPLNQAEKPVAIWHGGKVQGYRFAMKPVGFTSGYYFDGGRRTSVSFYLRIVLALNVREPLGVVVYRSHKDKGKTENFDEAFPVRENVLRQGTDGSRSGTTGILSPKTQQAMLDFIKKGYPTGLRGTSLRFSPGVRNLRLRDRAAAPDGLLTAGVLADATVILVHDQPDAVAVTPDQLHALLAEMVAVAQTIGR